MSSTNTITPLFQMSDKVYDFLNGLVKYVFPGLATLYLGIAAFWGLPNPEAIAGSITLVATFLGGLLAISKRAYLAVTPQYDGDILVDMQEEGEDLLTLALENPIEDIRSRGTVTFKVVTDGSTRE